MRIFSNGINNLLEKILLWQKILLPNDRESNLSDNPLEPLQSLLLLRLLILKPFHRPLAHYLFLNEFLG